MDTAFDFHVYRITNGTRLSIPNHHYLGSGAVNLVYHFCRNNIFHLQQPTLTTFAKHLFKIHQPVYLKATSILLWKLNVGTLESA